MSDQEVETPLPGMINDRYRVVRLLGRGGMGQVFLVEDTLREDRRMALKTLLPTATHEILRAGFENEFAEIARLRHPNLARAYDFGRIRESSEYYFTTEFIEGVSLVDVLGDASIDQLIDIAAQVLKALDFVHSHGILHNDLKPENLLLEASGAGDRGDRGGDMERLALLAEGRTYRVKLIDFGLVSHENTAWEHVLGTPFYISPERILCHKADRRSDLYSVGVLLYLVFAKRLPFTASDRNKLFAQHLEEIPPSVREFYPYIPEHVDRLIARLLAKRPGDRFQSAAEALDCLEEEPAAAELEAAPTSPAAGERLTPGGLVHRGAELQRLYELLKKTASGAPESHAVILQGASGTGKTILVQELRGPVQVAGGCVVEVAGSGIEGNLRPIREAFTCALKTCGAPGLEAAERQLEAGASAGGDPADILEKIILECARETLLLLHLDDFDRASRTVRRFAVDLLLAADQLRREEGATLRLLVVVCRRSPFGKGNLRVSEVPVMELENFCEEESREFLEKLFGQGDIPPGVVQRLFQLSKGNPLFLVELANQLVEDGLIARAGARWRFPETLSSAKLPQSLEHLFREKIAGLNTSLIELLRWAAVSGDPLPEEVLSLCAGLRPNILKSHLESLVRKNLLASKTSSRGSREYYVSHAGGREILLEGMDEEHLRHYHRRIAQCTEDQLERWEDVADTLARHWLESGNTPGFLRFAPRAADLLQERGDLETAVEYRKKIVEAVPPTAAAKKVKSLARLAEMHEFLWDLKASLEDLEQLRQVGGKLLKPVDRGLLLRRMGCIELARFRFEAAAALLQEAALLLAPASQVHRLSVAVPHAIAAWSSGRREKAREELGRSAEALLSMEAPAEERGKMLWIAARNHLAAFQHQAGRLDDAATLLEQNFETLRAAGQPQATCATECLLGSVYLDRGRYEEALARLRSAHASAKQIGDRRTLCRARERLGRYFLRFRRISEALRITRAGLQDAESLRNPAAMVNSLRTLAEIYRYIDEQEDARETLRRAVDLDRESVDPSSHGLARIQLARLLAEEGDTAGARVEIDASAAGPAGSDRPILEAHRALADFELTWRESGRYAGKLVEEARKTFRDHGYHGDAVDAILVECDIELEAGHAEKVPELLEELKTLTNGHREPDLRCEATYFVACLHARHGDLEKAESLLSGLRRLARDDGRRRLMRLCAQAMEKVPGTASVRLVMVAVPGTFSSMEGT